MGRSAGHLALGHREVAGATLVVIGEEFPRDEPVRLSRLVDILEASMLKRIAHGRPFGVAVLAEGIGLRLPQDELAKAMPEVERRARPRQAGRVRAGPPAGEAGQGQIQGPRAEDHGRGQEHRLRAPVRAPIPFDIEYTRDLGYSAVAYLKQVLEGGEPGGMITIQEGHMVALPFGSFNHPETGRVRIRLVNCASSSYHDPAGSRGPRGSGQAPPDRSGRRAHARGLPRPVWLSRPGLSPGRRAARPRRGEPRSGRSS